MGEDSGSKLSELASMVEAVEEKRKGTGRPGSKRAAPSARQQQQSTQESFRSSNGSGSGLHGGDDDDIFATPGKPIMRGALARSHSAAVSSP
jgi:hypothetical protein